MCEKAFERANEAIEGVKFLACKGENCVMFVASTPAKAEARMKLIWEKFPRAKVVGVEDYADYTYIYTTVCLGAYVKEQVFFENEIGKLTVKMEDGKPDEVCYLYIGEKCSFNWYKDIPQIVDALVSKDWSKLQGIETKSAIMHDLYDADIISHEEYRNC